MTATEFFADNYTLSQLERKLETALRMIEAYGYHDRLVYRINMIEAAIELRQSKGWK